MDSVSQVCNIVVSLAIFLCSGTLFLLDNEYSILWRGKKEAYLAG